MYNRLCIRHEPTKSTTIACSSVNMSSKWCCVLAVVCLSVILLSLDANAQPTTDDITSCSASTLEEVVNMVKTIASNQQQNIDEISDELTGVKRQQADCGCASAKSTTVNPIYSSTQSTPGTSCLVTRMRGSAIRCVRSQC